MRPPMTLSTTRWSADAMNGAAGGAGTVLAVLAMLPAAGQRRTSSARGAAGWSGADDDADARAVCTGARCLRWTIEGCLRGGIDQADEEGEDDDSNSISSNNSVVGNSIAEAP